MENLGPFVLFLSPLRKEGDRKMGSHFGSDSGCQIVKIFTCA
jgi:hypothetical protein